jgi:hypothetical protein
MSFLQVPEFVSGVLALLKLRGNIVAHRYAQPTGLERNIAEWRWQILHQFRGDHSLVI